MINSINNINLYRNVTNRSRSFSFFGSDASVNQVDASCLDAISNYNLAKINPLDKYVLSEKQKEYIASFDDIYDYLEDSEEVWDLFKAYSKDCYGDWIIYNAKDENKCPWKIHVYLETPSDYMLLSTILLRYFIDNDVNSKIIVPLSMDELNSGNQKGKAICIYPKSNEDFKTIAKNIDYIIKANGLEINNSKILGDRKLGDTGRLFYRYEYSSKKYLDTILDLKKGVDYAHYCSYYDKNRLGDNYLANDMTQEDDPFLNLFNHNI